MKILNQVASTSGLEIQMFFKKSDTCPGRIFIWEKSSTYKVSQVSKVTGSGSWDTLLMALSLGYFFCASDASCYEGVRQVHF